MPSIGLEFETGFYEDLYAGEPTITVDAQGTAPALVAASDGRMVAQFSVTGNGAASDIDSLFEYRIRHLEDGDDSGNTDGTQAVGRVVASFDFEITDDTNSLAEGAELQVIALKTSAGTGVVNVRFDSATSMEVFLRTVTTDDAAHPSSIDVSSGVHRLEIAYVAGSSLAVYLDDEQVALAPSLASHSVADEIGIVAIGETQRGTIASGTPTIQKRRLAIVGGDFADTGNRYVFSEDASVLKPRGLFHFGDITTDTVAGLIHDLPGRHGWANLWVKALYATGDTWPGDGNATETTAAQMTEAKMWCSGVNIGSLAAGTNVMVKIVCGDDLSFTNSWTSGIYETRTLRNDSETRIKAPIRFPLFYCMKGYGRGHGGAFDVALQLIDDSHDTIALVPEDEIYSDDREENESNSAVWPRDINKPPAYSTTIGVGSGIGVMLRGQAPLWRSAAFNRLFSRIGKRGGGSSDHVWDNNWDPTWDGDTDNINTSTPVVSRWGNGGLTFNEIHDRGVDFIENAWHPHLIDNQAGTSYRILRVGPIAVIHVDTYRYRNASTMLGSTQLSWLLSEISSLRAKTVLFVSPTPMMDAVWKIGQDWNSAANWRTERATIAQAFEDSNVVESWGAVVGDAHLPWWYPDPLASYPKCKFEFAAGATSSTMLANTQLGDPGATTTGNGSGTAGAVIISDVRTAVTAGGRAGWVHPDDARELGDGTHQRNFGDLLFGLTGDMTATLYDANVDPDDADFTPSTRVLQTSSLSMFDAQGAGSGVRTRSRVRR